MAKQEESETRKRVKKGGSVCQVTMAKYLKPTVANVPAPCNTDVTSVMKPALSIETKNVVTYMAGYLL